MRLGAGGLGVAAILTAMGAIAVACGSSGGGDGASPGGPDGSSGGPGVTPPGTDPGANPPGSSSGDPGATDGGPGDAGKDASLPACAAPTGLGRGLTWVRANPMMIAGLSVAMGSPSTAAVNEYFDGFHANAVHLWENGLPTEIGGWSAAGHAGFRYVSWVDAAGKSVANGQLLGGIAPLAGRIGYQISDEPLDANTLADIAAGAAAVKAADPTGLRIVNLNDSNGADAIRTQAAQLADIDVVSYDHYSWGTNAASGLMKVRTAAMAAGKPYWRYMKGFWYKSDSPEGTAADLRWDAFVGAVFGFTGYTWFVYSIPADNSEVAPLFFQTGGSYTATKTSQYAIAAELNQELARLGRALVGLRSTDVRYVASISILRPSGVSAWSAGAGGDPYLSGVSLGGAADLLVGFFRDDCDEPYVMVQNQAHPGGEFPNSNDGTASFTLSLDFSSATDPTLDTSAVSALDLTTGAVTSRALTPDGAKKAKLELTLPAGDVLLFKYADARAFSLQ
jgi:hypothetical protein